MQSDGAGAGFADGQPNLVQQPVLHTRPAGQGDSDQAGRAHVLRKWCEAKDHRSAAGRRSGILRSRAALPRPAFGLRFEWRERVGGVCARHDEGPPAVSE